MAVYVSQCPYDPDFVCHIGCKDLYDKPCWCTHRDDLYEKALKELEEKKEKEKQNDKSGIEVKVDISFNNFQ